MATYSEFVTFIKGDGLARQNRFMINLAAPAVSGEFAAFMTQNNIRDLLLLSKSVNVPGVNLATSEVRTTGEVMNAPYDRNFGAASFSFYVDSKMMVRKFFDDWINSIQHPETRVMGWYKDFAVPEIEITVIPRSELGVVYKVKLHECFPKSIGALNLDNENNGVMTLDVEMDFHYYTTEIIEMVPASTGGAGDSFEYTPETYNPEPVGDIDTYNYRNPPMPEPGAPGSVDTYVYKIPGAPPVTIGASPKVPNVANIPEEAKTALNNANNLPGLPTAKGVNTYITDRVNELVELNPVSVLRDNFSSLIGSYSTQFEEIQKRLPTGEFVINGVSVPLNVGGAISVAREQSMSTVRSAVTNAVSRNFKNIRVSKLFF